MAQLTRTEDTQPINLNCREVFSLDENAEHDQTRAIRKANIPTSRSVPLWDPSYLKSYEDLRGFATVNPPGRWRKVYVVVHVFVGVMITVVGLVASYAEKQWSGIIGSFLMGYLYVALYLKLLQRLPEKSNRKIKRENKS